MIQRIQSIYLLLAAAVTGLQFALPYATAPANTPATTTAVFADGQFNPVDNIGLLGLAVLGAVLSAVAIFLFKNRPLQGRLAGLGMVVSVLAVALLGVVFFNVNKNLPAGSVVSYGIGGALPVLAIVLNWLAQQAIRKDDEKVRSMDRLR